MRRAWFIAIGVAWVSVIALAGCGGVVKQKISDPIDVSTLDPIGRLHIAADAGAMDDVKSVLESDPSLINKKGDKGMTALHYAAYAGKMEVVKYLLEKGADPTILDDDSNSPATAALSGAHLDVAKVIDAAEAAKAGGAAPAP